jgi:hypothetical protein
VHFDLDERATRVRDEARAFAARVLAPDAAQRDAQGGFPRAALAEAAKLGLLGVNLPRALGGLEAGAVAYSAAVTELARTCAATTVAMCVSNMVGEVVNAFGTESQRQHWIPRLCDGSAVVGAFALSESGAGSDPGAMTTRARRVAGGWVLEGSKLWITSGSDAGLFVVWARTNDAPGARGVSCFLLPGDAPGLVRGRPEHKMGLNGSTTTALEFQSIELPDDALLGEEGRGFRIAMMALDGGRIGIASQALGIGQAALEGALAYVKASGGRPPQWVQWKLADAGAELEAARLLALRAAWSKQRGVDFSRQAALAKVYASERAVAACDRALEVLGAAGVRARPEVERAFRDVRVTMIYEGTSEVQRIVISREIARRFGGS